MSCFRRSSRRRTCCRPCRCADRAPDNCNKSDKPQMPFLVNMAEATRKNTAFRTTPWTGTYMQNTLMCIPPCGEIGAECHADTDQFICIVEGQAAIKAGTCRCCMTFDRPLGPGSAVFIPACTWHNVVNTGRCPLKLYSIYAPPHHPPNTVHQTKCDAARAERCEKMR